MPNLEGLFMWLLRPNAECDVLVDRGPYSIGDTVNVTMRFCPAQNFHVLEVRIYLILADTS